MESADEYVCLAQVLMARIDAWNCSHLQSCALCRRNSCCAVFDGEAFMRLNLEPRGCQQIYIGCRFGLRYFIRRGDCIEPLTQVQGLQHRLNIGAWGARGNCKRNVPLAQFVEKGIQPRQSL